MTSITAVCAAYTLAHFLEQSTPFIVATNPIWALRLALMTSEVRAVRA